MLRVSSWAIYQRTTHCVVKRPLKCLLKDPYRHQLKRGVTWPEVVFYSIYILNALSDPYCTFMKDAVLRSQDRNKQTNKKKWVDCYLFLRWKTVTQVYDFFWEYHSLGGYSSWSVSKFYEAGKPSCIIIKVRHSLNKGLHLPTGAQNQNNLQKIYYKCFLIMWLLGWKGRRFCFVNNQLNWLDLGKVSSSNKETRICRKKKKQTTHSSMKYLKVRKWLSSIWGRFPEIWSCHKLVHSF